MNIDFISIVEKGCIPLIIAILALGLPVLLQTASNIDDKYHSTRLMNAFYKESISKLFIIINISSLISIVIWYLNLPRVVDLGNFFNLIIDNSAFIFVFTNTIVLVFLLFKFIKLIKTYYHPLRLFKHLEKLYDR